MDKEFPYHHRLPRDFQFKLETPSAEGRIIEQLGSSKAVRQTFANGDELFTLFSDDYVDIFSTFEITITEY
ncbi:MAG TPA: hypothetical protein VGM95_05105 [Lactobacillaceae bacterium]|jgi:hypothetical protein